MSRTPLGTAKKTLYPLSFILLVLGITLLALAASGGPSSPSSTLAQSSSTRVLHTIPFTDLNPYGANFYLHREVEQWKIDKTLQMASEAGIGWIKQHFPWEDIESSKGQYLDARQQSTWAKFDLIVTTAEKYGLKIIARLDRPPGWTRNDNSLREAPPDNIRDYADFVRAVVARYKGRINYYQLWNEPNIYPEWGNNPVDPAGYVALLRAGYQAAKAVDPNVVILSAPLAQTLERSERNMSDIEYLRRMYEAGAKDAFDILLVNAYGFSLPPDDPPDPNKLNFSRFRLLRDVMEQYGDSSKAVWFNEFGWNAAPDNFAKSALPWGKVTEEQQAEYTVKAIQQTRASFDWAGVFCIWYFRQDGHIRSDSAEYYFRMVDPGFTARPVYDSVKKATAGLTIATDGTYQESNPAVEYSGQWQQRLDTLASGGSQMVAKVAEANATIKFAGTGISLVVKKAPDAGVLYVTVDGSEANLLPKDSQNRSILDLGSSQIEWHAEVPVADNLGSGEHTLRLAVAPARGGEAAECAIDGFAVRAVGDDKGGWVSITLILGLSAIALALLALWRVRVRSAQR